jgi:hypothetical protein
MPNKFFYFLGLVCLFTGCSIRQAGYSALGAGAGAGIGYSIHHNAKDAVIGGLGGAIVGDVTAQIQDSNEKKQNKKDYDKGYAQAQVDLADQNWQAGTGQYSQNNNESTKRLARYKVPKREEDGVIYDEHYVTLEEYQ